MTEQDISKILEDFRSRARTCNPCFTVYSLCRTVEVQINTTLGLGFMNLVSSEDIDDIVTMVIDEVNVRESHPTQNKESK